MFAVALTRMDKSSGVVSDVNWDAVKKVLRDKAPSKLGKSAWKILEMVYNDQYVTIPEMANTVGTTERAVEKNIQKLKEQRLITRKKGDRSGHWALILDSKDI